MSDQNQDDKLHPMRHSLAHIMATAVLRIWPEAKLGIGPVVENGFYYDIDNGEDTISDEDFAKIEAEMKKIVEEDQEFEQFDLPIDKAIAWAEDTKQPYKLELLNDLKRAGTTEAKDLNPEELGTIADGESKADKASFYKNGEFVDLCRGPHVASTGQVGAFKLLRIAGAYWRGDETKPQMQRLYGVAFETQEELDKHLHNLEEAKKRDHRILGKQLELMTFSELVGSGLPLFGPRGATLRNILERYSQQVREKLGYQRVWIPHVTKNDLYKTSGHWAKFGDELFLVKSQETSDELVLKPMNCPHHIQIYDSQPRSYRELPIKYMENSTVYRDEKSGELQGLERVRSITQDDGHVFCEDDQIEEVINELVNVVTEVYKVLDMPIKRVHLSFKDEGDQYLGDADLWEKAQKTLQELADKNDLHSIVDEGEAAFYGPKIDFIATDAIDRETQVATIQLDFVQPKRFELEYTDNDGALKTPVMVHAALLGSIERFLSVYIEHTAGHFPFWLAPEQIRVLSINDEVNDYVKNIQNFLEEITLDKPLKHNELRFSTDARNESLSKKIKEAQELKIPVMLIVGPRDEKENKISVRVGNEEKTIQFDELKSFVESVNE